MSTPLTKTEVLPQGKNRRRPAIEWTAVENPTGYTVGHLTIHVDRATVEYEVQEFPADDCRGIALIKKTPGTDKTESHYCLTVSQTGVVACECRGFVAHASCKHKSSVEALLANRWI